MQAPVEELVIYHLIGSWFHSCRLVDCRISARDQLAAIGGVVGDPGL